MCTVFRGITTARYGPCAPWIRASSSRSPSTRSGSARHKSGFALRFPRIVRLRPDKGPGDIATLGEVREIHARLTGRGAEGDVPDSSSSVPT